MIPINVVALGTLPPDRIQNASGLFNLTRNLGGAFGLAAINTMLENRTDLHADRLAEGVSWGSSIVEERLAALTATLQPVLGSDAEAGALRRLAGMVQDQALVMSFADILLILAAAFAAVVLLRPLVRPPKAVAVGCPRRAPTGRATSRKATAAEGRADALGTLLLRQET